MKRITRFSLSMILIALVITMAGCYYEDGRQKRIEGAENIISNLDDVELRISGSGSIRTHITNDLEARVSGSGNIRSR